MLPFWLPEERQAVKITRQKESSAYSPNSTSVPWGGEVKGKGMESRERIFSPVPTAHKLLLPERFSKRWELTGLTFSFEKHDSSNTFSTKAIFVVLQKKKKRER